MSRTSSIKGAVTITVDARREGERGAMTGEFHSIADVLPLMIVLADLCGEQTQVFFDFGVISFVNVDLAKLRERFEKGASS